jgi:hypothetical protein
MLTGITSNEGSNFLIDVQLYSVASINDSSFYNSSF